MCVRNYAPANAQVQTVILYYECRISQLPTVKDLAEADEISYYTVGGFRSLFVGKNMQVVTSRSRTNGGHLPNNRQDLRFEVVSSYTAGAIASIAFDQPTLTLMAMPCVFSRVLQINADISTKQERLFDQLVGYLISSSARRF